MNLIIEKGPARGKIQLPPSKSISHRLLISAALSEGKSVIRNCSRCEDVLATIDCLEKMGAEICWNEQDVTVYGISFGKIKEERKFYCRESGSTIRFLVPIAMLSSEVSVFSGAEGLMKRPMTVFERLFKEKGLLYQQRGKQITVQGPLQAGIYRLPGNISSQFVTGLLFSLPLLQNDSLIEILPPVESRSYIDLTIAALEQFGITVNWKDENTLLVKGKQKYQATDATVEGDASGAAFLEAFNYFDGNVQLAGLGDNSLQGDTVYKKYFEELQRGPAVISLKNCPDLAPILFAVAAAKYGGIFTDTGRLKIKESDRAEVMAAELRKFGTTVQVEKNSVHVIADDFHKPDEDLSGHGDHRIVMALSVLLTLTGGMIQGAEAVQKSYPEFFTHLEMLNIGVRRNDFK